MVDLNTVLIVANSAAGIAAGWWLKRKLKILETLPAQFAKVLTDFSTSMKMSDLGQLSGQARGLSKMAKDVLAENPDLLGKLDIGMVLESVPELKKYVGKYPFLAPMIQGIAARFLSAQGGALSGTSPPQNGGVKALPNHLPTPEGYHS